MVILFHPFQAGAPCRVLRLPVDDAECRASRHDATPSPEEIDRRPGAATFGDTLRHEHDVPSSTLVASSGSGIRVDERGRMQAAACS